MSRKLGLGNGLDILLTATKEARSTRVNKDSMLRTLPIDKIQKGQYQPRLSMDPESLQELADSIKAQGVVQPIVVRRTKDEVGFELIAGERRWRAAQLAGLHDIPAVVRDITDQAAAAMSLIENIQREDLKPLEEAIAMERLIHEFGLTHQQTAEAVGRSRSSISNLLRLIDLESPTKAFLENGHMEMGHARALLGLKGTKQVEAAHKVVARELNVRETERLVKRLVDKENEIEPRKPSKALDVIKLEQSLSAKLGAKVVIQYNTKGKGKLVVDYNNLDELDGILAHIQ